MFNIYRKETGRALFSDGLKAFCKGIGLGFYRYLIRHRRLPETLPPFWRHDCTMLYNRAFQNHNRPSEKGWG